ncbi:unnamed protein product [Cylindrotheca closterium]|uniref:Cytochrome b561 domain-containing protein n=1 Tax=Cylindrotheca closterium TaxID=2856 RepID=A0AAD2JGD3_9STRA|nr:unnamed protein product [Cylindrotheca closterium]
MTIIYRRLMLLLLATATITRVQAQVALCRNTDWIDEDGCGCDEYDFNQEWCDLYGEFVFEGESANTACCACGGGRIVAVDTVQTDPPIILGQKNCILSPPIEIAPGLTVENWIDNDSLLFRMRIVYEGEAWIGISFENDGRPGKPPYAVIGKLDDEATGRTSVKKYLLNNANPDASGVVEMPRGSQTLEDAEFLQTTSGKTVMTFTKPTNDVFDSPPQVVTDRSTWIFAVGNANNAWTGAHTITGKFNIALTPCFTNPWEITNPSVNGGLVDTNARRSFLGDKPNRGIWIVHGIALVIAWGIIAPLGLATTFLKRKGPKWAKVNQFCNTSTLLTTCAGILLGVVATYLDDRATHLQTSHAYYGVGVFGGFLMYCLLALYFGALATQHEKEAAVRRGRKRASRDATVPRARNQRQGGGDGDGGDADVILGMGNDMEVLPGGSPHNPRNPYGFSNWNDNDLDDDDDDEPPKKASGLEWFSRFLFLVCIGVAYYTCQTGLDWQFLHFDLDWEQYYWGLGAVGAVILVLLLPLNACLQDNGSSGGGGGSRVGVIEQYQKQSSSSAYYGSPKSVALGAQDSMQGSVMEQQMPNDYNPYEAPFFPKAVEEDTFYPPFDHNRSDADDSILAEPRKTVNHYGNNTNPMIDVNNSTNANGQLQYLEDEDAQRSPMHKSWDLDCCQL